jgi:hypothetical protein
MTTTTATKWPEFGPADPKGFRQIPFYIEGDEFLRVNANLERVQKYLTDTANDDEQYSSRERESLETAAAIIAAREDSPDHDPEVSLATIINLVPDHTAQYLEKWFPLLAKLTLEVALNLCVKRGLDETARSLNAPGIYKEADVDLLLADLKEAAMQFLKIDPGRPRETADHLKKGRAALKSLAEKNLLNGKRPKQELFAEELRIQPRTLRLWLEDCDLSWVEFLRACGWTVKAEGI